VNTTKSKKYIFIFIFLLSPIFSIASETSSALLGTLLNKTFKMQYYFIKSESNKYFLLSIKNKNDFYMWRFTTDKKWEPVHNAGAYDGFDKADKTLSSATYSEKYVTIGSEIATKETKYIQELADKKFKVLFYFWTSGSNAFLIEAKDENTISLWNLTSEKKWMPLHNAGAYDGFAKAGKTILDISFDFTSTNLTIGAADPITNICIDTGFCQ